MVDYAVDRSARLEAAGFFPDLGWKKRTNVSVSENGKTYRAAVAEGLKSAVFQIDGQIIRDGAKCDKYLAVVEDKESNAKGMAVFIELKGKDVSHAIDQLEVTLKSRLFLPLPQKSDLVRARIVTAGCRPKSSSKLKLEEVRKRFKILYNTELRVLKNLQSDTTIAI
ncbi:MAG: hypothetical protein K2N05_05485 [Muribaculaceae bacterium]|nr:hypothetical protein [Muribaculaceae bacterium]